jgi:pyrroline-5-carboxylate reductase
MTKNSLGFIGGGRVTTFILNGFKRKGRLPKEITVSDGNPEVLKKLKEQFPEIEIVPHGNTKAASKDIVFLALHPPAVKDGLAEIKSSLRETTVLISLAPRFTITNLSEIAGGFRRIIRMIPNAPSFVNEGYNPVVFSDAFTEKEKKGMLRFFSSLGDCPEVAEEKLEAYAIITAMGPTYLWFQIRELQNLAQSFGMTPTEAEDSVYAMASGTLSTLYESGLSPEQVMDLVPVKPIAEEEENIRNIYRTRLQGLYGKLKG